MPSKSKYHRRADGYLELAVKLDDGSRRHLYGKTDADIERKLIALKDTEARGRLFGDVLTEWEAWHSETVRPATIRAYQAPSKDALARFEKTPIKDISAKDIKAVLSEMARKQMSIKTIKKYYTIYHSVLEYAAENGYVENNVAQYVTMPKFAKPAQKREAATEAEEKIIAANSDKWLLPYFLMMTGLRKGEALALQYKDIDRVNHTIAVSKAVCYRYNMPVISEPKTASGYRTVPILDALFDKLPDGPLEDFIFSGEKPMTMMVFQRKWNKFRAETGITCSAHQLRHSYATMLYNAGIDVKQAQDLLGHANEAVTMDIYTHIRDSKRQAAADALNQYLANRSASE